MKTVSNEYIRTMEQRRGFYAVAEITFQDGTKKTLEKKDFTLSGNSVVQSAESTTFPLGMVIPRIVKICLMNEDDRWSAYDFFGAKIFLRTKFDLNNGLTESINVGNFTVITPESYGTTIEITATDDSYKLDKDYSTNIRYPTTIRTAVQDSCRTCGVTLFSTIFKNADYEIQTRPENLTHRQFIGLCAMIAGGNAWFDEYNRLVIQSYDFSEFERAGLDGGYFDNLNASRYMSGDNADGGSFNPWNTGDSIDGGNFKDIKNIHVLHAFKSGIKIGTDDVVITGVKLVKDKEEWLFGSEGYVLSFENQLATGKEEETVRLIGELIVGLQFRPFTGDHVAYPLADFMDLALLVDRKGNVYKTVLTDIDFQYYGFTTLKCSADSPIRNSSKYYGSEVKAIVLARQIAEEEISDYDKTAQDMTAMISQGFGLFFTKAEQEDGSVIPYMHDKPTMAESSYIVTSTSNGLLVSNNGGTSWAADRNGNALFNVITAHGLNADWIITGRVSSKDGSVYFDLDANELVCNKMINTNAPDNKSRTIADITYIPPSGVTLGSTAQLRIYPEGYSAAATTISSNQYNKGTIYNPGNLEFIAGETHFSMGSDGGCSLDDSLSIDGTLQVDGAVKAKGGLSVTGVVSSSGAISANGGLSVKSSFSISNGTSCNIYADVNMNNYTMKNVKISGLASDVDFARHSAKNLQINTLVGINGYTPYTGHINFVRDLVGNGSGGISSWSYGRAIVTDGIITSVSNNAQS